ncbi:MAG: hypothetical protein WBB19_03520 [Desulforhopalus sp.]
MADRIFGCIALAIIFGYGFIAFTVIEAPFQYDPLGPETWPRIFSVFACLCCAYIIILPDGTRMKILGMTLTRIAVLLILLSASNHFLMDWICHYWFGNWGQVYRYTPC